MDCRICSFITLRGPERAKVAIYLTQVFIRTHPSLWLMDLDENLREVPEHVQWFILGVLKL